MAYGNNDDDRNNPRKMGYRDEKRRPEPQADAPDDGEDRVADAAIAQADGNIDQATLASLRAQAGALKRRAADLERAIAIATGNLPREADRHHAGHRPHQDHHRYQENADATVVAATPEYGQQDPGGLPRQLSGKPRRSGGDQDGGMRYS